MLDEKICKEVKQHLSEKYPKTKFEVEINYLFEDLIVYHNNLSKKDNQAFKKQIYDEIMGSDIWLPENTDIDTWYSRKI